MKISALHVENIKALHTIDFEPGDASLIVVGGRNAQGKTSVLDSIAFALGGKELIDDEPIHRGSRKGKVTVELTNGYRVERTFTARGGQLKVLPPGNVDAGAPISSPQTRLNEWLGAITFDPLAFSRMKAKDQRELLAGLVGLDFTELDAKRERAYSARHDANQERHRLEGARTEVEHHDDVPEEPVDISDLLDEQRQAEGEWLKVQKLEADAKTERWKAKERQERAGQCLDLVQSKTRRIEALEEEIEQLRNDLASHVGEADEALAQREEHLDAAASLDVDVQTARDKAPDLEAIRSRIANAEGTNRKVRENGEWVKYTQQIADLNFEADEATATIKAIDEQRKEEIANASYPLKGLAVDDDQVIFQDLPLSQASGAEQLRVSVALGMALNPELKVLLVRDGSLLDDDSLEMVRMMAAENDAQLWLERVGTDAHTTITIEEGEIR
jgi:DNA repair exonuclease SbcCD ATPase subunit